MTQKQNHNDNDTTQVEIPYQQLPEATLRALLEEYVSRDGADWDQAGCALADKVAQVLAQVRAGKVKIVHDLRSETTNLIAVP